VSAEEGEFLAPCPWPPGLLGFAGTALGLAARRGPSLVYVDRGRMGFGRQIIPLKITRSLTGRRILIETPT
jgi:hypothetical protein